MTSKADDVTEDAVLGGRLRLRQPRRGHRVGHDAILLAAACPARPGDTIADLGAGVGAAGLAVAARVANTTVTLVEIDSQLVSLADSNVRLNGLEERVRAVSLDVAAPARAFAAAGLGAESVTQVLMNPPFNDPTRHRPSPDPARRQAHMVPEHALAVWVKTASRLLRPRGSLTLIWRADGLAEVLAAVGSGFGALALRSVHPRPELPAIRILLTAVKASRAPLCLLPPLILADAAGNPTAAADALLCEGATLAQADA